MLNELQGIHKILIIRPFLLTLGQMQRWLRGNKRLREGMLQKLLCVTYKRYSIKPASLLLN